MTAPSTRDDGRSRAEFWRGRLRARGHTGWNDPIVYAYDQLERLERVRCLVPAVAESAEVSSIDFGCGVGDFSCLLLDLGYRVWGHDPFVEPNLASPRFTYLRDRDPRRPPLGAAIALSVTALDHILDEAEFCAALAWLHANLSRSGRLLALEYALDDDTGQAQLPSQYQAFRSMARWNAALEQSGFVLERVAPFPHPHESPSAGYLAYRRQLAVRLLALPRMRRLPGRERCLRRAARRAMACHLPGAQHDQPSPLKLLSALAVG